MQCIKISLEFDKYEDDYYFFIPIKKNNQWPFMISFPNLSTPYGILPVGVFIYKEIILQKWKQKQML